MDQFQDCRVQLNWKVRKSNPFFNTSCAFMLMSSFPCQSRKHLKPWLIDTFDENFAGFCVLHFLRREIN